MAVLTVSSVDRNGVDLAAGLVAAAGGGDSFPNTGTELLVIQNTSGSIITVTMVIQSTVDAQTVTSRTFTVAATTGLKIVGPFPTTIYNDTNSRVNLTYSGVTNLKVCPVKPSTN